MIIDFQITNIPKKNQEKYSVAYFEGILKIFIDNKLFFNRNGIPLIEFAIFVNKWLDKIKINEYEDFIYNSMDHDEPIISIIHLQDNYYRIDSLWKECGVFKMISKKEIIFEFKNYLEKLNRTLKNTYHIELKNFV